MSGIVSLVAASAALYMHQASYQRSALEDISNISNSSASSGGNYVLPAKMYVYASLESRIYQNATNPLNVVVSLPPGASIRSITASSENATVEPAGFFNLTSQGIGDFEFMILPHAQGPIGIGLEVNATYENLSFDNITHVYAFSVAMNGSATKNVTGGKELDAAITYGNQSIFYNLTDRSSVMGTRVSNHCLYQNFWYQPYPVSVQCGTSKAWDFWIFDDVCYTNGDLYRVYCVYPTNTTYSYYEIASSKSYAYNITLRLYNSSVSMSGVLNRNDMKENLTYRNRTLGNAIVTGVTGEGPRPYTNYIVLNSSSGSGPVNISTFDAYSQTLESMRNTLAYYNNTGVSQDQIDQIWQAVGAYNHAASAFEEANYSYVSGCALLHTGSMLHYACAPYSNLDYMINASVLGNGADTYSVNYRGTVINVNG
ncbi:MAG: hypothetical protein M1500_00685 [Candidatus Marsarchaeota archaeon]|nr:hypothetical protein [Candidatus Marsarchaeota archaeon]MCL5112219.1 hypothetical protein [Candidatus Marsarchaeota archaeon]